MFLVLLLYFLFASTFTIGKAALLYISPMLLIAIRMIAGGALLLGIQYFFKSRDQWRFEWRDAVSFFNITLFLIFISFISEFWALKYVTATKACLLYNLSPFITALLAYLLLKERLTKRQWLGMIIGFLGFLPILMTEESGEEFMKHIGIFSMPEIALIVAVASSCYGWIIMKHLVVLRNYSTLMVNGISMVGGGIMSLIASFIFEKSPRIFIEEPPTSLLPMVQSPQLYTIGMIAVCIAALILIANVVCFNLYGILLRQYSPTFIAFAGFTTPAFAALLDFIFLGERVTWSFYVTMIIVFFGLWVFYKDELRVRSHS